MRASGGLRPEDLRWLGASPAPASPAARPGPAAAAVGGAGRAGDPTGGWCHLVGELHAPADLARRLGASLRAPAPALALAAFRRWGAGAAESLEGDYAAAAWDGERLLLVRDALGAEPLLWARLADGLAFSDRPERLLAHPAVDDALDVESVAGYLAGWSDEPDRTFFAAVRPVPPGHLLVAGAGGVRLRRWWDPRELARAGASGGPAPPAPGARTAAAERLWELLVRAAAVRLADSGAAVAVLGSGGLDSSTVATAATVATRSTLSTLSTGGAAGAEHPPPVLCSFVFTRPEAREEEYATALVEQLGIERLTVAAEAHPPLASPLPPRAGSPFVAWEAAWTELLELLAERGIARILTGHGGDDLFAGSRASLLERIAAGEVGLVGELVAAGRTRAMGPARALYRYLAEPRLPLAVELALRRVGRRRPLAGWPPWLAPELIRAGHLDERWRRREGALRRAGAADAVALAVAAAPWARGADWYRDRSAPRGVVVRHPLLDRRVVEHVLATPPALLYDPWRDRPLLRDAGRGRLAPALRRRTTKARMGAFLDLGLRRRAAWLEDLLDDPRIGRCGWVRPEPLRAACRRMIAGSASEDDHAAWTAVTLEIWLRERPWDRPS